MALVTTMPMSMEPFGDLAYGLGARVGQEVEEPQLAEGQVGVHPARGIDERARRFGAREQVGDAVDGVFAANHFGHRLIVYV